MPSFSENLTQSDFNETYSPVELAVLDSKGNPLTADTQLFVGDVFQLHVYLTDELGNCICCILFSTQVTLV